MSVSIDTSDDLKMLALIRGSIGTKFVLCWAHLMCRLVLDAAHSVATYDGYSVCTVDIKRCAHVEKVPSGEIGQPRLVGCDA